MKRDRHVHSVKVGWARRPFEALARLQHRAATSYNESNNDFGDFFALNQGWTICSLDGE
jgi:hypothetical protein